MILEDDLLNGCEAIYIFLGPFSSDHLSNFYGGVAVTPKRSKFSLTTLFRSDKIDGNLSATDKSDRTSQKTHESSSGESGNPLDFNSLNSVDVGGISNSTLINDYESACLEDHSTASNAEQKSITGDSESKDSIAEPLYALMGEIFDMGGVFKWLRKSLISFVQITYGRTINR